MIKPAAIGDPCNCLLFSFLAQAGKVVIVYLDNFAAFPVGSAVYKTAFFDRNGISVYFFICMPFDQKAIVCGHSIEYAIGDSAVDAIFPCLLKAQHGRNENAVIRSPIGPIVELAKANGDSTAIVRLEQFAEAIIELAVSNQTLGGQAGSDFCAIFKSAILDGNRSAAPKYCKALLKDAGGNGYAPVVAAKCKQVFDSTERAVRHRASRPRKKPFAPTGIAPGARLFRRTCSR